MSNYNKMQELIMGNPERIYREFRDASTSHALVTPSVPRVTIYNPEGTTWLASSAPVEESTGVFYYNVNVATATGVEGVYQAFWEGIIGGAKVSMDTPQYFRVKKIPWEMGTLGTFVWSIRRLIGDTNPDNFRVSTIDIWYYIQDAIKDVQAENNLGYTTSVSNTDGLILNKDLTSDAAALFRFRTMILILNSVLFNGLFCAGNVDIGDIKVNITNTMRERREMLKWLDGEYKRLMYEVKMGLITGIEIDTFVTGYVKNSLDPLVWDVNLGTAYNTL